MVGERISAAKAMRGRLVIATGFVMAVTALPTSAQTAPGHFQSDSTYVSKVDASIGISKCVLARRRAASIALAGGAFGSPAAAKARSAIKEAIGGCMGGARSLTLRAADLRGALAELLLEEDGGAALARVRAAAPIAPTRVVVAEGAHMGDLVLDCVVRAQPEDAAAMIDAAPGSVEESEAFQKIGPSLKACVPNGGALKMKAFQVRLLVAAALYRRVGA